MKKLLFTSLLASVTFSSTVDVKRDKVVLQINGKEQVASKGEKLTLNDGDEICIIDGKGKIVIDKQIQISLKSRNKCFKNYNAAASSTFSSKVDSYLSSEENSVSGMTRGIKKQ